MDSREVTEVCRLCPGSNKSDNLIDVFDERLSVRNNMKEVILVTTGIEILESDMVSKKVCQRCCNVTIRMFHFRQDAIKQDRFLKEKFNQILTEKGVRLPNTCVTIKRERANSFSQVKQNGETCEGSIKRPQIKLHPSVIEVYRNNPKIKIPKRCLSRHINPVVSLPMDQVEIYFKERKLDMRKFIYKSSPKPAIVRQVARKKTAVPAKPRTVAPLLLSKSAVSASSGESYVCTPVTQKGRKRKLSELSKKTQQQETTSKDPSITSDEQQNAELKIKKVPVSQEDKAVPDNNQVGTSKESTETSSSKASSNSKPQFIESLGLVPTVTTTKSQTIHVCNLCGSVHNNAFKLKKHINKHMVCQFCKLKFKSLEAKQDHIEKSCQVKNILNSPEPVIDLEKVDQNVSMSEQFRDAFSAVGLETSPVEDTLKSPNNVGSSDDPSVSAINKLPNESVAEKNNPDIIIPNVLITDDKTLEGVNMEVPEDEVLKNLIELLEPQKPKVIEKILQTDSVQNKDIKVNLQDSSCEFKGLRQLFNIYKIPVAFTHGQFHVGYQFKKNTEINKVMATWNHLPLTDVQKKKEISTAAVPSSASKTSKQHEKKLNMTRLKNVPSKRLAPNPIASRKPKTNPAPKGDASSSLNKSLPPVLVTPSKSGKAAPKNRSLSAKKTGEPGSSRKTTRVRVKKVWELK